jgi:predicted PurR-regulated permease PerM
MDGSRVRPRSSRGRLESWHVPRPAGIAIVLGGTLGALILFLALVVPGIAAGILNFIPYLGAFALVPGS